jgi:hypothetical protein
MNKRETGMVMAILQAAFPAYYRGLVEDDAFAAVNLWTEMFADEDVANVLSAVKALIATQVDGYPPTVGKVKNKLVKMKYPDRMSEFEAWETVLKAVRNSLYHSDEEFEKLPELLRRIVVTPNQLREWAMMDIDSLGSVVASNFMRSYRNRVVEVQELDMLPEGLKKDLRELGKNMFRSLPEASHD